MVRLIIIILEGIESSRTYFYFAICSPPPQKNTTTKFFELPKVEYIWIFILVSNIILLGYRCKIMKKKTKKIKTKKLNKEKK
jgi:hypothetical protein